MITFGREVGSSPVREEGSDDGDAVGGREPAGVDEEEELHEAVVRVVAAASLHHVHILHGRVGGQVSWMHHLLESLLAWPLTLSRSSTLVSLLANLVSLELFKRENELTKPIPYLRFII